METNNNQTMSKKMTGIVAYISYVGFIIAYLAGDKEGAKQHLNSALLVHLISVVTFVPYVGHIFSVFALILWCIGLSYAIKEEDKELPIVGSIKLLGE